MYYRQITNSHLKTYLINLPHKTDSVFLDIFFPAGFFHSLEGKRETSHLLEHYLNRCITKTGIDISAVTNNQIISFFGVFTAKEFANQLTTILYILFDNNLTDGDIYIKEKNILLNELSGELHDPSELSQRLVMNACLENQQLSTVSVDEYKSINQEDMLDLYHSCFSIGKARLFIGAYKPDPKWVESIQQITAKLDIPSKPTTKTIINKMINFRTSSIIKKNLQAGRIFSTLAWSFPINGIDISQKIALLLALDILSRNDSGLLWQTLQRKAGLIYNIDGHVDYYSDFGFISVRTAFMGADLQTGLGIMRKQVKRVLSAQFPVALFQETIKLNLEDEEDRWNCNEGRFYWIVSDLRERGEVYNLKQWKALYAKIDKDFIAEVASTVFVDSHLQTVLVGDDIES